ncbi:MAG: CopD family protein [Gammaproteobacteria bacterium]|nr:CopD family protein [Gammaproteobacteria bacterium]
MEVSSIPGSWESASLLCKFLFYVAAASTFGGAVALYLYGDGHSRTVKRVLLYQLIGALLGFHAVLADFLVQVGQINNSGISGAFDLDMANMLLSFPLGDLSFYRLAAFALMMITSAFLLRKSYQRSTDSGISFYRFNFLFHGLGLGLILLSFRFGGHVSLLALPIQLVLVIHFTTVALWLGALYPLYELTNGTDIFSLQSMLQKFSNHAIIFVFMLLLAGIILAYNLIHSPAELLNSAYGRTLSVKLLLVFCLLSIAGLNKFHLVPHLMEKQKKGVEYFRRSLRLELTVASLLLLVTAYFSTVVGPLNLT